MGRRGGEVTTRSFLLADAAEVWAWATSPAGINFEMAPVLSMSVPPSFEAGGLADVEPGARLGRSWLRLFGLVPVDYDDLTIAELESGRRFLERSTMLSQRRWEHERIVEPREGGCEVIDRVAFAPRLAVPGRVTRPAVAAFFAHRHRRLRRRFAGTDLGQTTRPR